MGKAEAYVVTNTGNIDTNKNNIATNEYDINKFKSTNDIWFDAIRYAYILLACPSGPTIQIVSVKKKFYVHEVSKKILLSPPSIQIELGSSSCVCFFYGYYLDSWTTWAG